MHSEGKELFPTRVSTPMGELDAMAQLRILRANYDIVRSREDPPVDPADGYHWRQTVSGEYAGQLEKLLDGVLAAVELPPDMFGFEHPLAFGGLIVCDEVLPAWEEGVLPPAMPSVLIEFHKESGEMRFAHACPTPSLMCGLLASSMRLLLRGDYQVYRSPDPDMVALRVCWNDATESVDIITTCPMMTWTLNLLFHCFHYLHDDLKKLCAFAVAAAEDSTKKPLRRADRRRR